MSIEDLTVHEATVLIKVRMLIAFANENDAYQQFSSFLKKYNLTWEQGYEELWRRLTTGYELSKILT